MARAEQAVGAQAVDGAGRHLYKVGALGVVASVDDLESVSAARGVTDEGGRTL